MGRDNNFHLVYTDVSDQAGWRSTIGATDPWEASSCPALTKLWGFTTRHIATDLLHCWNLGCLRDMVGSCVKILVKDKWYFAGRTIDKRLATLARELRAFSKTHGMQLSIKTVKRSTVAWASDKCPELHSSGYDAVVFARYLLDKLLQKPPPRYSGLTVMMWAGETFVTCLQNAGPFLTAEEAETVYQVGNLWIKSFVQLANEAAQNKELLFKCRPKMHFMHHTIDEARSRPSRRNASADTTWVDEDYVKSIIAMKKKMDFRTSSENCLRRSLVVCKQSLSKLMQL